MDLRKRLEKRSSTVLSLKGRNKGSMKRRENREGLAETHEEPQAPEASKDKKQRRVEIVAESPPSSKRRQRSGDGSEELGSPSFDPLLLTRRLFTEHETEEIRGMVAELQEQKRASGVQVRQEVHAHYPQFIAATRHIQQLEADMLAMRQLFARQQATLLQMSTAAAEGDDAANLFLARVRCLQDATAAPAPRGASATSERERRLCDEVDALVAECRFEEAVAALEAAAGGGKKRGKGIPLATSDLSPALRERVEAVTVPLVRQLRRPESYGGGTESTAFLNLLMRLGKEEEARETMLEARRESYETVVKRVQLDGDVEAYVSRLARVAIAFILSASKEYRLCFPEPSTASAFVVWAMKALSLFASIFRRHVHSSNDPTVVAACHAVAQEHCLALENEGLALSFYLDSALQSE